MSHFKTVLARDLEILIGTGEKINVIDVREPIEYQSGHIPGSQNNPLSSFDLQKLQKEQPYYLICASGSRSLHAANALARAGYHVINVEDGIGAYRGVIKNDLR